MKEAIKKILIFLFMLIIIDRFTGLYLSHLYEKNYCLHSGGALNDYLKNSNSDIAFVGSSRVNTMIDPEKFSPHAIDVSQPAKHFLYHVSVVDLMVQHKKMPSKVLVMNIEIEDLYVENQKRLVDDVFYLKYYYGKNQFITDIIQHKSIYERFKFLSSCYRFNGENFRLLTNPLQNICVRTKNGFSPLQKTPKDSIRLALGVEEMKELKLTKFDNKYFKYLNHLVKLCSQTNTKLILVYGPNFYYPESFKNASLRLKRYCNKKKIHLLDFSLNQNSVFNEGDLWYDHIHLNAIGAEIYSTMLKEKIDQILK